MLIDSNAYIGHWPFRKFEYNHPDALLGRMKEFGTDLTIISHLNGVFYKNTQSANEELHEVLQEKRKYRESFIPFAVINPIYGGWREDFDTSIGQMGMKGVRLYPKYHFYDLTNPACIELVKMCRDKGVPVVLTLRMVDSRTSSWLDIEKEWALKDVVPIVRAVPDAKYIICNVANNTSLNDDDVRLFREANLLMDTSGRNILNWSSLLSTFGIEKFCFGTHAPLLDYASGLLRIEALRESEADEAAKEQIRSGNLKKMLGI